MRGRLFLAVPEPCPLAAVGLFDAEEEAMAKQMHELQKDPPEGSREVIDRELKRQDEGTAEQAKPGRKEGEPGKDQNKRA